MKKADGNDGSCLNEFFEKFASAEASKTSIFSIRSMEVCWPVFLIDIKISLEIFFFAVN